MRIPPELLIDGCVETLAERVLPALTSRYARGQLYAVIDVLRNLRDRVEERSALLAEEAASAAAALERAADALRAGGAEAEASRLAATRAAAPEAPAAARRDALDAAMVAALRRLDELPPGTAAAAQAALGGHLAAQALRALATLKPSMLEEISKG